MSSLKDYGNNHPSVPSWSSRAAASEMSQVHARRGHKRRQLLPGFRHIPVAALVQDTSAIGSAEEHPRVCLMRRSRAATSVSASTERSRSHPQPASRHPAQTFRRYHRLPKFPARAFNRSCRPLRGRDLPHRHRHRNTGQAHVRRWRLARVSLSVILDQAGRSWPQK
jgi:hypothetical protein